MTRLLTFLFFLPFLALTQETSEKTVQLSEVVEKTVLVPHEEVTRSVNSSETKVKWIGSALSKKHWGHIPVKSASVVEKANRLVRASFVLDMTSLDVGDIPADKGGKDLEKHLKNDDFFSTKLYPEAKLVVKDAVLMENGMFLANGDLTIKGITKPIKFNAKRDSDNLYSGSLVFNRADYGIKYKSKSFFSLKKLGDKVIYDNVEVAFSVALN